MFCLCTATQQNEMNEQHCIWQEKPRIMKRTATEDAEKTGKEESETSSPPPKTVAMAVMRIQPLHNGHHNLIKLMVCSRFVRVRLTSNELEENDEAVLIVGSAQEHGTLTNPYTADQRTKMVRCLVEHFIVSHLLFHFWSDKFSGRNYFKFPRFNFCLMKHKKKKFIFCPLRTLDLSQKKFGANTCLIL
jgi:hypothetical protein